MRAAWLTGAAVVAWLALGAGPSLAALPEIRLSAKNTVDRCATPSRLMRYLDDRNPRLNAAFRDIAALYKKHGEANRVRWDYAFFQMLVETGYLTFRASPSRMGDVNPRQFNFAGIGTTGGGVPGDRFQDASTGVLAHIQHLVVYSGETLAAPVARRTREVQDDVAKRMLSLRRNVTFADLTNRWAMDRRYARSIEAVAERFFSGGYCNGPSGDEPAQVAAAQPPAAPAPAVPGPAVIAPRAPKPAERPKRAEMAAAVPKIAPPAAPAPAAPVADVCRVMTASYGGDRNVLIRAKRDGNVVLAALGVAEGQEDQLSRMFISEHLPGGERIGTFATRGEALLRALEICPGAAVR